MVGSNSDARQTLSDPAGRLSTQNPNDRLEKKILRRSAAARLVGGQYRRGTVFWMELSGTRKDQCLLDVLKQSGGERGFPRLAHERFSLGTGPGHPSRPLAPTALPHFRIVHGTRGSVTSRSGRSPRASARHSGAAVEPLGARRRDECMRPSRPSTAFCLPSKFVGANETCDFIIICVAFQKHPSVMLFDRLAFRVSDQSS